MRGREDADERARGGSEPKVTLCHKGRKALTVGAGARAAHLAHGDTAGSCPEGSAPRAKGHGKARGKPGAPSKAVKPVKPAKAAVPGKARGPK